MNFLSLFTHQSEKPVTEDPGRILLPLPLTGETAEERAANLLNRLGCRQWIAAGQGMIGYWPDLDGPELRYALSLLDESVEIISLEHSDVPEEFRIRFVPKRDPGEPIGRWLARVHGSE